MRELTLSYVDSPEIGYGRLGVNLARALTAAGVDVFDDIGDPEHKAGMRGLTADSGRRHKKTNAACWVSTPGHARGWWNGQTSSLFSMWEAMRLPEAYREHLHNFDTVIVPSEQNLELFGQYHPNVKLCLLGVDPEQWFYVPRTQPGAFFNFLCGGTGPRKGTDLAVKAFRRAFPGGRPLGDGPIPRLILKNPKGEDLYGAGIEMVTGRLLAEEEIALYASAHCYVQPSRGEGFGLQPLQAMAQGIPTILTDAHGHASFAHLGWGLSTTPSQASYFIFGDAGDWWEPDLDELVEHMRTIYLNYDIALVQGQIAAQEVAENFTWADTAAQFVDAFDGALDVPYTGDGGWFAPEYKRYLTILTRDWTADIAGTIYYYKKGVSYYEPSDVKRILFEAGLLDPACLEAGQAGAGSGVLDTGLTERQIEKIGGYSAHSSFCEGCGQQIGTRETKADILFNTGEKMRAKMAEFGLTEDQVYEVMNP